MPADLARGAAPFTAPRFRGRQPAAMNDDRKRFPFVRNVWVHIRFGWAILRYRFRNRHDRKT
jgi:hypothetical protein